MAYCVNCGVELEKSIQNCPLCGVEVNNPKEPYNEAVPKPYSRHVAGVQQRAQRRVIAAILSVALVLAAAICVMANLVYDDQPTWSLYVLASMMLVWVTLLLPLLKRMHPVALVMLDVCALLVFLYLVNMADTSREWYFELAIPLVLLFGTLGLLNVGAFRSKHFRGWEPFGIAIMSGGVAMLGLEAVLDSFNDMQIQLGWSWFVALPALAVGVVFFIAERRRRLKEAIYKRLRL
ncbi:DUF6320 domain-containing protein [Christensenellaceae bacterium OttesenSCG-928-L17]|nr:DUF6320 domain-containing protein [Christensenellaceae bacterium OttesenSCG-928-L17]